jgi:hypothetical protein
MSDKLPSLLARPTTWTALYRVSVVVLLACIAATLLVGEVNVGDVGYVFHVDEVREVDRVGDVGTVESVISVEPVEVQILR